MSGPSSNARWKQRFRNFSRRISLLREALQDGREALSTLEQEGAKFGKWRE